MHRDQRLGLALGILLIGIVSAFFFRNESEPTELPPELIDPDRIDELIADNDVAPYLSGLEDHEEASGAAATTRRSGSETDQFGMPDFLRAEQGSAHFPGAGGPPNPIARPATSRHSIPIPRENDAWEPVTKSSPAKDPVEQRWEPQRSETDFVIHQVERGETLSGIAQRYSGSSLKFTEIYEANRELLRNPDDLRLGMKLRIPRSLLLKPTSGRRARRTDALPASERKTVPAESPAAADPSSGKSTAPAAAPVKRFIPVPARGLPRRASRRQPRRAVVPVDKTPNRLTQRAQ